VGIHDRRSSVPVFNLTAQALFRLRRPKRRMAAIEQIKAKRAGVGLRALDPDRAWKGFTLFAPQSGGGKVYLIDLEGKVIQPGRCLILLAFTAT
jgi:hypothetical protein